MTEQLTGKLADNYQIPQYAQGRLLLQSGTEATGLNGASGAFRFTSAVSSLLTLRWQEPDGPALGVFHRQPGSLGWDGHINIGGYLDAIHFQSLPGTDHYLAILYLGGQPLQSQLIPDNQQIPNTQKSDFHRGLSSFLPETVTTWIVDHNHPLVSQAMPVLLRNTRMHLFGQLADEDDPASASFGLPIRLHAMTVFAP